MNKLAILAATALFAVPAFAADHTVLIHNHRFSPAQLTIAVGDTVTFVNQDSSPHTATAAGAFDTGRLGKGDSKRLTFAAAGSFAYICKIHPSMHGTIKVK
jgi:plastocyanin